MSLNVENIRKDFPILNRQINGKKLIYFDNAATSQTPLSVINSISDYYKNYNANIHRGVHSVSEEATDAYEKSRVKIQNHFNAKNSEEIIFTSGTTHSINIVANGYVELLNKNDEIIVSGLEHHSNIVPWQMMTDKNKAKLNVIPLKNNGELDIEYFKSIISIKTKVVFLNHVSNALGIINPIKEIIDLSHKNGAVVLIDGAQSSAHFKIDVQELDVDFFTASAHKLCGPTGIGFLYGKKELLENLSPLMGGGEMISDVSFEKTTYADLIGLDNIFKYENELLEYAIKCLKTIDGLKIYGEGANRTSVISFNIENIHPYDIGSILDKFGIAVRTGQHCAQPIMDHFHISGTVRVSLSFINTKNEIDKLIEAVKMAKSMLS